MHFEASGLKDCVVSCVLCLVSCVLCVRVQCVVCCVGLTISPSGVAPGSDQKVQY